MQVDLVLRYRRNGRTRTTYLRNISASKGFKARSRHRFTWNLRNPVKRSAIVSIGVYAKLKGGTFGKNWLLTSFKARLFGPNEGHYLTYNATATFRRSLGSYVHQFNKKNPSFAMSSSNRSTARERWTDRYRR